MQNDKNILMVDEIVKDRYKVIKLLGRGSYGQVYLVENIVNLNKHKKQDTLALKIIPKNKESKISNNKEINIQSTFSTSGNIAKIHDMGDIIKDKIEYTFIAMDLYPNGEINNLASDIDFTFLTNEEIKYYFPRIIEALKSMHNNDPGYLHKDIKNSNILLSAAKEPYITDFGISQMIEEKPQSIGRMGTPKFMAPELIDYETINYSKKNPMYGVDIYALGVILYNLATSNQAYLNYDLIYSKDKQDVKYQAIFKRSANTEYIYPDKYIDGMDKRLVYIINKMLSKDYKKRYKTTEELLTDFDVWINDEDFKQPLVNPNEVDKKMTWGKMFLKSYQGKTGHFLKIFNWRWFAGISIVVLVLIFVFLLVILLT